MTARVSFIGLLLLAALPAWADSHPAAPPPPPTAASAPQPSSVSDIVIQLAASENLRRNVLERLPPASRWAELERRTVAAEAAFARYEPPAGRSEGSDRLIGLSHDLWALNNEAAAIVHDLGTQVHHIENDAAALARDAAQRREGLPVLVDREVPAAVLAAARAMLQQDELAAAQVRSARDQALLALVRAQALQAHIHDAMAQITQRMEQLLQGRAELEQKAIWRLSDASGPTAGVADRLAGSAGLLRSYFAREGGRLALTFAFVFLICAWLFMRPTPERASPAQRAYGRPFAAALLIALVAAMGLAPDPPVLFYSLLLLAMPLPVMLVAQRSFGAGIPLTLAGMTLATALMALRNIVDTIALADRLLLLAQIACVAVPLAFDLRSGRLQQAIGRWSAESVRAAALVVLAAAALSGLHVVFGLGGSFRGLRVGIAGLIGFGLIFGTAATVFYGALLALLATPLFTWLHSARHADPALLRTLRIVVALAAAIATAMATLGAMTLVPEALSTLDSASRSNVEVGAVTISASALATALAVVLATFALAAAVHFLLDREIFPRLQLRPGSGYAIATFTRWSIFIVGGVLTLAALGVDATRITLLAGALGVGIGFGLQTVVNNFVSGLILIVERPVAVGDLIEIGPLLGEIQRIGIRSSSVRTTHGAEVIVPNSDLASKEVINWTRSDRRRRYDIDVGVAYGSDPTLVMRLLEEAARDVPEVIAEPAPMAMFKGFGESSLDFRLLAWVSSIDLGVQAQTALRVAVKAKLDAAGITMPFPQREVHLVGQPAAQQA